MDVPEHAGQLERRPERRHLHVHGAQRGRPESSATPQRIIQHRHGPGPVFLQESQRRLRFRC